MNKLEEAKHALLRNCSHVKGNDELVRMVDDIEREARQRERDFLIDRGDTLVALYLDGPLRDSAYSIFEELKRTKSTP